MPIVRYIRSRQKSFRCRRAVNTKDWSKTLEGVEDYLCNFSGITGIPLNYVVRKQIIHTASSGYP